MLIARLTLIPMTIDQMKNLSVKVRLFFPDYLRVSFHQAVSPQDRQSVKGSLNSSNNYLRQYHMPATLRNKIMHLVSQSFRIRKLIQCLHSLASNYLQMKRQNTNPTRYFFLSSLSKTIILNEMILMTFKTHLVRVIWI